MTHEPLSGTDPSPPVGGLLPWGRSAWARPPWLTGIRAVCALLLAAPVVALGWVGSYTAGGPALSGVPFFYWYQ